MSVCGECVVCEGVCEWCVSYKRGVLGERLRRGAQSKHFLDVLQNVYIQHTVDVLPIWVISESIALK